MNNGFMREIVLGEYILSQKQLIHQMLKQLQFWFLFFHFLFILEQDHLKLMCKKKYQRRAAPGYPCLNPPMTI